jgi:hypothetical protein
MRFHKVCSAALVSAALCFSTTNAAAASCQAGGAGCLLPFQAAPMAPPVVQAPPVTPVGVEPVIAEGGGIGILPILLGLAALGLLAFFLLDDDDAISV